jgi:hypothetical protein
MPCYLFSYHAYGSWLPDHRRGYVRRKKGILPSDDRIAAKYRANLTTPTVLFNRRIQRLLIDEALIAASFQNLRCHYLAAEPTHIHVLVSWRIDREWRTVRAKLRESLSRRLNTDFARRPWFSKSPSRKRVNDRQHFDYLANVYLPKHSGLKWSERIGWIT